MGFKIGRLVAVCWNMEIDEEIDVLYKPGLLLLLDSNTADLCTIYEQNEMMETYDKIAGYR